MPAIASLLEILFLNSLEPFSISLEVSFSGSISEFLDSNPLSLEKSTAIVADYLFLIRVVLSCLSSIFVAYLEGLSSSFIVLLEATLVVLFIGIFNCFLVEL